MQNEIEEIKRLINLGFDLELLSFELDIPIEQLQECKRSLDIKERRNEEISKEEKSKDFEEETKKEKEQDYDKIIKKYKNDIASNPQSAREKRNLLAFAYFKAGKIEDARKELIELIEETSSHMAYRQLIHLEKITENIEDSKLWAYEALDKFPDSIEIREQLISIARKEKDYNEIIKYLSEIVALNPKNEKNIQKLKVLTDNEER